MRFEAYTFWRPSAWVRYLYEAYTLGDLRPVRCLLTAGSGGAFYTSFALRGRPYFAQCNALRNVIHGNVIRSRKLPAQRNALHHRSST
jgi:hypothetical protein